MENLYGLLKSLWSYRTNREVSFRVLPRLKKCHIQGRSSFMILKARVGAAIEQKLYELAGSRTIRLVMTRCIGVLVSLIPPVWARSVFQEDACDIR